jgi:hypothetical protein
MSPSPHYWGEVAMSVTTAARSAVLAAYLGALACHGSAEPAAQSTALAIVAVWTASFLRDRHRRARVTG